jgi:hypothetical protein
MSSSAGRVRRQRNEHRQGSLKLSSRLISVSEHLNNNLRHGRTAEELCINNDLLSLGVYACGGSEAARHNGRKPYKGEPSHGRE